MSNTQATVGTGVVRAALAGRPWRRSAVMGTIRGTILLACLSMSLLTAGLGLYAAGAIRAAGRMVADTFDQSLISITYAREAGAEIAAMQTAALQLRAGGDPARQTDQRELIDSAVATLHEDLRIAALRAQSPHAQLTADAVAAAVERWRDLVRAAPLPLPAETATTIDAAMAQAQDQIELLTNMAAGEAFRHREEAVAMIGNFTHLTLAGTIAALALSAGITWLLARRIIGPVAAASTAAGRIAGGDMQTAIPSGGADELGRLLTSMAMMRDSIRAMMEREVEQRRSAQSWLVDAVESSSEGVILAGADGTIALVNTQALAQLAALAEFLRPGLDLATLATAAWQRGVFRRVDADEHTGLARWLADDWAGESEMQLADGRWLRISRSQSADGGSIAMLNDITTLKSYQDALEQANTRFEAALNNMSQGLCLFDATDRLQVLNDRFREIYHLPKGTPSLGIGFRALVELRVASSAAAGDGPAGRTAGEIYHEHAALIARREEATIFEETEAGNTIAISHVPMEQGGWVATFEDITAQRRSMAQIQFMSRHDQLTSLGNRTMFIEQLSLALAQLERDRHVAALHLNLDHFKAVNDTLGHLCGDQLLHRVGQLLVECHGNADMVARLGGDEFAIVLAGIAKPQEAADLARKIIAAIGRGFEVDGHAITLGVSIGIAVAPGDGDAADRLAEHADVAMDRAKTDSRGTFRFFEPAMNAQLQLRRMFELDLRKALADDELDVYFQPLVDLAQKRITGFEALLRWRHPALGMVSPAEFIPLAEELGLIVPIGEWVLRRACSVAATWPDHIKVAVNVSPIQFKSPHLVHAVSSALADSRLAPGRLELEITESVLLASSDTTLATLRSLKELGTRIAMDDFGTGYSSLSYLRSFPFDKMKIDQSFIKDLRAGNNSGAIVSAIAAMAANLGIRTTAEGVETEEQLALVQAAGCNEVQGFLFSKPRPSSEIPALITAELAVAV